MKKLTCISGSVFIEPPAAIIAAPLNVGCEVSAGGATELLLVWGIIPFPDEEEEDDVDATGRPAVMAEVASIGKVGF